MIWVQLGGVLSRLWYSVPFYSSVSIFFAEIWKQRPFVIV